MSMSESPNLDAPVTSATATAPAADADIARKYYIGDAILKPAPHHESFEQLWESKWLGPCKLGVYPFMFGSIKDFEPIAKNMIEKKMKEPYDWDDYASMFFPKAEELAHRATQAEKEGNKEEASELFLRSSAVYRIARFPAPRSAKQFEAWAKGKEVFYKGQSLRDHPIREVRIPHVHRSSAARDGADVYFNYLAPPSASSSSPAPLLLIISGLDGYRTELAVWQQGWLEKSVATLVAEIPGTGDSPAAKQDPTSPDRQWSTVLDWIAQRTEVNAQKVIVWGFSTGGYYSLRLAHTHHDRLLACISQGGGAHHMFDREWLQHVDKLEYPFDLCGTLAHKFGYQDSESFVNDDPVSKFSLLNDGTLEKPCTKVLLVNGSQDEIFPIDDMFVALSHGSPKEARIVAGKKHMGEPDAFFIILRWIYDLLDIPLDNGNSIRAQMSTILFQAKF